MLEGFFAKGKIFLYAEENPIAFSTGVWVSRIKDASVRVLVEV